MAPRLNFRVNKDSRVIQCPYDAERFALTTADVEPGYAVWVQNPTPALYLVVDVDNLDTEAGYFFIQHFPDLELAADATVQEMLDAILPDQTGKGDYVLTSDGANAEWRIVNTTGIAATQSEVDAGDNEDHYVAPKTLKVLSIRNQIAAHEAARGYAISDGATSNRAEILTPGTIGAVAGLPMTFLAEFTVPTSDPSATIRIFDLSPSATSPSTAVTKLTFVISSGGDLVLLQSGATVADQRIFTFTDFRAAYSGQDARLLVTLTEGNSTTAPRVELNGIDISSSFVASTSGTPPNWMDASLVSTYFLAGYNWPSGRVPYVRAVIGSFSTAESEAWGKYGTMPAWATFAGSAVELYTRANAASLVYEANDASTGVSSSGTWTITSVAGAATGSSGSYYLRAVKSGAEFAQVRLPLSGTSIQIGRAGVIRAKVRASGTFGTGLRVIAQNDFSTTGSSQAITADGSWQTVIFPFTSGDFSSGADTTSQIGFGAISGSVSDGATLEIDDLSLVQSGPIDAHSYQPALATFDRFGRMSRRLLGFTPVSNSDTFTIFGNTSTSGNEQLLGGAVLSSANDVTFDHLEQATATGTPTTSVGSASGGAQYKASGAIAAGLNVFTPVTRKPASTSVWVASSDTTNVRTILHGHKVSVPVS